ncbi:MAG TPA: sigma-70 family RNA polymerase sigma factor [Candidatus Dormibacteraeota bacterium]|nr:sigma-70 family RNA polymerase sigma factor [Candidatus Dormibacteraeota bacterium]
MQAITANRYGRAQSAADPFERLFRDEYSRVVGIAYRVLADRHEAEDVAQEVFVDFHRLHRADAPYAGPWLHRAAANTALNAVRSRSRRNRREASYGALETQRSVDPADVAEVTEERLLVRAALARLPGKSATVLALRYGGLSYAEVAQALGVKVGQIGTLLRRAEAKLRREVDNATS